ncbi:hypothetical protein D7X33_32725 [Butyricicoccus sp. 1XD8-22]|nr:hypothetical protein D7X33_32725 [Butyricicoccus sp. 1XD8-22]
MFYYKIINKSSIKMVRIFEMQQQLTDIRNYQSRIVEFESFQEYLQNVNETSLPRKEDLEVYQRHVNFERQTITFMYEHKLFEDKWVEFVHFAQVID